MRADHQRVVLKEVLFEDACTIMRCDENAKKVNNLSHAIKLELYGLFKQGTKGDIDIKQPGFFDRKARYKYFAWKEKEGMDQDDAKAAYVTKVQALGFMKDPDFIKEKYPIMAPDKIMSPKAHGTTEYPVQ